MAGKKNAALPATTKPEDPAADADRRVAAAVEKRTRATRPFPACAFEEALSFAKAILDFGSGQQVRRMTLFDDLGKSPESGPSRQLITNASKYGLIDGSYKAEFLKLTADGQRAVDDEAPARERARARIKLGIEVIEPFNALFVKFINNKLPPRAALIDAVKDLDVPAELAEEAVDTFVVNMRFVGLLQTLSGAERIISVEHYLDGLPSGSAAVDRSRPRLPITAGHLDAPIRAELVTAAHAEFDTTCFYISPIG